MRPNPTRSALIMIDMESGFVDPQGGHCIRYARPTVPACVRAVETARSKGIPVFFVKRIYRADGSDVELTRYAAWKAGGRACMPASVGPNSAQAPEGLRPRPGDYTIIKPRWSAFFQTELDLILRRLDVRTVLLAGTTTPNCVRSTAYDALSLGYNVAVIEDATSSRSPKVQAANLRDMAVAGVQLLSSQRFENTGLSRLEDTEALVRLKLQQGR